MINVEIFNVKYVKINVKYEIFKIFFQRGE